MGVRLRGYSNQSYSSTTNITVSKPTGTVLGDLMMVDIVTDNFRLITSPNGWSKATGVTFSGVMTHNVYYKVDNGNEPSSFTFTIPIADVCLIACSSFYNSTGYVTWTHIGSNYTFNTDTSNKTCYIDSVNANVEDLCVWGFSSDELTFEYGNFIHTNIIEQSISSITQSIYYDYDGVGTSGQQTGVLVWNDAGEVTTTASIFRSTPATPPTIAPVINIDINNRWKNGQPIKINIGGVWKNIKTAKIIIGGIWKDIGDAIAPPPTTVDIQNVPTYFSTTSPFNIIIQFSDDVSNFVIGDISLTNATANNFSNVDDDTYTVDITPTSTGTDVTINIASDVATDSYGNGNLAASQVTVTYAVASNFTAKFVATPTNYYDTAIRFEESKGIIITGTVQIGHVYRIDFNSAFDCAADVTPDVEYRKNAGSWLSAINGSQGDTDETNPFVITELVNGDYIEIRHNLNWGGIDGDGDVAEIITDITNVVLTTGTGSAARTSPYIWTTDNPFE